MVAQVIQYDSAPTSSEHDEPNCRNNRVGRKLSEKSPLRNRGSRVMTSAMSCDCQAPFPAGTTQTLYTRPLVSLRAAFVFRDHHESEYPVVQREYECRPRAEEAQVDSI